MSMTQPEHHMTPDLPLPLEPFEGQDVIASRIQITKAGDGLSEALKVDPGAFPLGAEVYVVLKCHVGKVNHVEVKDTPALQRVHTFEAQAATIVDKELVGGLVDAQVELIRKRREEEAGIQAIPFDNPPDQHPAVKLLEELKKPRLVEIAEANGITVAKSWTSSRIIEVLVDQVANIEDIAEAALDHDDPDNEATVTPIGDALTHRDGT
jgi:hypothetical protein